MKKEPRLTLETISVIGALLERVDTELAGADIARITKLATGTLYPILFRCEEAGWLDSRWEDVDPVEAGRPRRRLYRVTPLGEQAVRAATRKAGVDFRWVPKWA